MLTLQAVQAKIAEETEQSRRYTGKTDAESKKHYKRHQKTVDHLRELELILLSEPSEDYIKSQIEKHESRIHSINVGYETWKDNNPTDRNNSNAKAIYEKMMDIGTARRHLRYAKEIMNG